MPAYQCRGCLGPPLAKSWYGHPCPNCGVRWDIKTVPIVNAEDGDDDIDEMIEGEPVSATELMSAMKKRPPLPRIKSGVKGFDHVMGGGIVPGSLTLVCGSPGAGKSTCLIQVLNAIAKRKLVYYAIGEEPLEQVAGKMTRMKIKPSVKLQMAYDTDFDNVLDKIDEMKPAVVAIDSINTLLVDEDLEIGSTASIKLALREIFKFAKQQKEKAYKPAFIVIGHITKDGGISGPKTLEHMVDANIFLKGTKTDVIRTLYCEEKNRFAGGALPAWATFEMTDRGLIDVETHLEERAREEKEEKARLAKEKKEAAKKAKEEKEAHA